MNFVISDGTTKNIVVGSRIMVKPGYLPPAFDGQLIEVKSVNPTYPFVSLEPGQDSAISPEIITAVV